MCYYRMTQPLVRTVCIYVRMTVHFILYVSMGNDEFRCVTAPVTTSLITPIPLIGRLSIYNTSFFIVQLMH